MCWETRKSKHAKELIAKEDIHVFKIVDEGAPKEYLSSIYQGFCYKLGVEYTHGRGLELEFKSMWRLEAFHCDYKWEINKGFHSYLKSKCYAKAHLDEANVFSRSGNWFKRWFSEDKLLDSTSITPYGESVMECIIPKGAKYYVNEYGEVVSDKIKPISYERLTPNLE